MDRFATENGFPPSPCLTYGKNIWGDVYMAKIMVGIPIHRPIEFKVFESFIRMTNYRGEHELHFCMVSNSLIYDAREHIAEEFLKSECEYLMFIDSDMTFHPKSIEFLTRHKKDFVTAKAFKRVKPYQPCFYTKVEYNDGVPNLETPLQYGEGLLRIEGAGLACALIHRSVFERLEKPFFFPYPNVGEDLTFCLKMKEKEIEMFCDTTLQFGHLGHVEIFEKDFFEEYTRMSEQSKLEKAKEIK
jgi:hypothetical protein